MTTKNIKEDNITLADLNDDELKEYSTKRSEMFAITIVICIVYGIIALSLLIIALFTTWGQKNLYNDMAAFVFTFIIGTIIIIVYLSNKIYNFRPTKGSNKLPYGANICPDYWTLKNTNDNDLIDDTGSKFLNSSVNPNHFKYKCVLDENIFNKDKFIQLDRKKGESQRKNYQISDNNNLYVKMSDKKVSGINDDTQFEKFKEIAANMNGYTYQNGNLKKNSKHGITKSGQSFDANNIPISCDSVYPLYLSVMDNDNISKNPSDPNNLYRCAYSKACGVVWSEANCY